MHPKLFCDRTEIHGIPLPGIKAARLSRGRRWMLAMVAVLAWALAYGTGPTQQATAASRTLGTSTIKPTSAITVKATYFTITPSSPKYDDNTNLRFKFKVDGTGQKNVEWVIKRGSQTIASGTQYNAQAGQTYTVNKSWRADVGAHTFSVGLDPANKLGEPSSSRSDNVRQFQVSVPAPDWSGWMSKALSGSVNAVRIWQTTAYFTNIRVNAVMALGTPGILQGTLQKALISTQMMGEGCPSAIASKVADAVESSWKEWQTFVIVPNLPWYPTFAAVPSPQAPLTPNVPTPLSALPSARLGALSANSLKSALDIKLYAVKDQPGAQAAFTSFANQFATKFTIWRAGQVVTNVMGRGPVPNFRPPFSPVGPVVGGTASSTPGASLSSKQF